ncbi:MAG: hypothetical protein PUP92_36215 [Rhizonema sp. PD38]|nr:hypothetical protein [Rhizonema sp. PD38]
MRRRSSPQADNEAITEHLQDLLSPAITAVVPQGIEPDKIRLFLKERFNIELADGLDYLKNKIFRIGHLEFVSDRDIFSFIASLEVTLFELGYENFTMGSGVTAATRKFSNDLT